MQRRGVVRLPARRLGTANRRRSQAGLRSSAVKRAGATSRVVLHERQIRVQLGKGDVAVRVRSRIERR
jgi:hypothetical protein